ncbi:hypothetical protein V496_09886 [Pseudogymnoascus sp. VKM F-4515 (FW-2607)]|nr:hypothetical protein V496_09886 [Pseudogymnoascus sp. VKM F-4515 (FW-2607)]KFY97740.1 hypothetical protein V498_01892 [Pseudogymnoascus sp. VKM F-4517 (FW-2822)]
MSNNQILNGDFANPLSSLTDKSLFISEAFVDGEWVSVSNERTFEVLEPVFGKPFSKVADLGKEDFERAIQSAKVAQKKYKCTTATERGSLLRKWFDLVIANKTDLATILCLENGKTFAEAESEIVYAASFISWFAEEAPRSYGDLIPSSIPNTTVMTMKEPIGVCGIITPWNFPAAMITRKVAPALAAGCSVVIKPPKETPHTCLALTKLAIAAGLPPKCIQVCTTSNRQAATELATNPMISKLSFTGSTGVGKMLAKLATGSLKKCSLELGGNAPFIVFDDADLDLAVEGAMISKFRCSGQTCVCANRLLVQTGVVKEFTAKLVAKVNALVMGSGFHPGTTQGPLVNQAAVDKVEEHVKDAISKGAKVETGGIRPRGPGFFFQPTVLSGATVDMQVATDETFGPLAAIFEFSREDEVIELANSTEFGLAGYFFSNNASRVLRVARQLECGMVGVNTAKISASEAPFGGIKESGYGREGMPLSTATSLTTAKAYALMAFTGITCYNSIELVVLCLFTFKRYQGYYFWSLLIASICLTPNILGFILFVFAPKVPVYFSVTILVVGWCGMVTGQSLVLWSRLHLVHITHKHIRGLFWMIVTNAILLHVTTIVVLFGAVSPHFTRFTNGFNIMERIQLVLFCVQELILSGIYIWDTVKLLRLRPRGWRQIILTQLLIINIVILIIDVSVVAVEYSGLYAVQVPLKSAAYSVKLKLEYAILGRLVKIVKPQRSSSSDPNTMVFRSVS